MGWTLQYRARTAQNDIDAFILDANKAKIKLSWRCEEYLWEKTDEVSAFGFTKVEFSLRPKKDFLTLLRELQSLSKKWPHVRINACDDFVLGDWWHVRNIKIDQLEI